jgi:hypothetical protein
MKEIMNKVQNLFSFHSIFLLGFYVYTICQGSNYQLAALFKADIQKSTRWTFLLKITHKKGLGAQWADLIKRSRILSTFSN